MSMLYTTVQLFACTTLREYQYASSLDACQDYRLLASKLRASSVLKLLALVGKQMHSEQSASLMHKCQKVC